MDVNWIDYAVLAIVVLSTITGMLRGLFGALFGLIALVAGFYAAAYHAQLATPVLQKFAGDSPLVGPVANLFMFCFVFLAVALFSFFVRRALRKMDLGGFDTMGGVVFGIARGLLFSLCFILALSTIAINKTSSWESAKSIPFLGATLKLLVAVPLINDYQHWLTFDQHNRPSLVVGHSPDETEDDIDTGTETPIMDQILDIQSTRQDSEKMLDGLMEEN